MGMTKVIFVFFLCIFATYAIFQGLGPFGIIIGIALLFTLLIYAISLLQKINDKLIKQPQDIPQNIEVGQYVNVKFEGDIATSYPARNNIEGQHNENTKS